MKTACKVVLCLIVALSYFLLADEVALKWFPDSLLGYRIVFFLYGGCAYIISEWMVREKKKKS